MRYTVFFALLCLYLGGVEAKTTHRENKCGKVCQRHIEGYKWAKKKGIDHPARCGDGSTTGKHFNAGCRAAASGF